MRLAQSANDQARTAGNPRRASDCSVAGNMAARDLQDGGANLRKQRVWRLLFGHADILNKHGYRANIPQ